MSYFLKTFILSLSIFCVTHSLTAQNKSNRGKEFWLGYGHNTIMTPGPFSDPVNSQEQAIYISTEAPSIVTVSINGTTWSQTLNIPANTINSTIKVPKTGVNDARLLSEGLSTKGIHIISDTPIVVYTHQYTVQSSAASMLMPVNSWGYNYYSVNYNQTSNYPNSYSWFFVIASEDNTRVLIKPADTTSLGWLPTQTYTVNLNKGEIYNVFGKQSSASSFRGIELTGSSIVSVGGSDGICHPITVFSGSSRNVLWGSSCIFYYTNPTTGQLDSANGHGGEVLYQQMFPTTAWGTKYLTYHSVNNIAGNSSLPYKNIYRVAVNDPTTIVKRNGVTLTGLQRNFYYEFASSSGDYIEANKPILVTQYFVNSNQCTVPVPIPSPLPAQGDPEMIYLSPLEQGVKSARFYENRERDIDLDFMQIIVHNNGVASMLIDGTPVDPLEQITHPVNANYTVIVRKNLNGPIQHYVTCDSTFVGMNYGWGGYESYGYNLGCNINNLNSFGGVKNINSTNGQIDNIITCPKTPTKILAKVAFAATAITFKFSQVAGVTPNTDVTINSPTLLATEVINGRTYYVYETTLPYEFANIGTYIIPITYTSADINGCNNSENSEITVTVKPGPTANYTIAGNTCPNENVLLNNASSSNGFTINNYLWNFPDATTQNTPNAVKTFTVIGNYNVRYRIFADNGCVGDTTKVVNIGSPLTALVSGVGKACADSVFTFTSSLLPNASNPPSWYWDFGDGSLPIVTTTNTVTHSYTALATTRTLRHAVGFALGCGTDTVDYTIPIIIVNPTASFQIKKDTICADKPLLFTSNLTSITTWDWNFGNGLGIGIPPFVHNYTISGSYDVSLIVTDGKGCGSLPAKDKIYVNPKPLVNAGSNQTIPKNSSILLNATISPPANYTYLWTPSATLNASNILQPRAKPNVNTTYYLLAKDANTFCSGTDSVTIKVIPVVYIPNAFTPNGDAVNPTWRIPAMAEFPNGIVTVYNRYGEKVYESKSNATNPWDGTFKGQALPMGTYTYVIQLNNPLKEVFTGTVILIR
jgi:gliding motility-associated-like protein